MTQLVVATNTARGANTHRAPIGYIAADFRHEVPRDIHAAGPARKVKRPVPRLLNGKRTHVK
jgi:hypothetical protein